MVLQDRDFFFEVVLKEIAQFLAVGCGFSGFGCLLLGLSFQVCDTHNRNGITVIGDVFLRPRVTGPDVVLLGRNGLSILHDPKLPPQ